MGYLFRISSGLPGNKSDFVLTPGDELVVDRKIHGCQMVGLTRFNPNEGVWKRGDETQVSKRDRLRVDW